jgi:hypothetical protein
LNPGRDKACLVSTHESLHQTRVDENKINPDDSQKRDFHRQTICEKNREIKDAALKLSDLISVCELAHAEKNGALLALNSQFKDKEDALQYFTALHAKANYFVTRNIKDYRHGWPSLPVFTPDDFIKEIT